MAHHVSDCLVIAITYSLYLCLHDATIQLVVVTRVVVFFDTLFYSSNHHYAYQCSELHCIAIPLKSIVSALSLGVC